MKFKNVLIITIFQLIVFSSAHSQESLFRTDRPFAVKLGNEGFGMDYSLADHLALEFTTIAFYHSLKARVFLFEKNATPYIGFGAGSFNGIVSMSEANRWFSVQLGWEHAYEIILIHLYLQKPLYEENQKSKVPFIFNLSIGMRVL